MSTVRWIGVAAVLACCLTPRVAGADALDRHLVEAQARVDAATEKVAALKKTEEAAKTVLDAEWMKLEKALGADSPPRFEQIALGSLDKPATPPALSSLCDQPAPPTETPPTETPPTAAQAPVTKAYLDLCEAKLNQGQKQLDDLRQQRDVKGLKELLGKVKTEAPTAESARLVDLAALQVCGAPESLRQSSPAAVADRNEWYAGCQAKIDAASAQLDELHKKADELASAEKALKHATDELAKRVEAKDRAVDLVVETSTTDNRTLSDRLRGAREVRCFTAYCWGGDGTKYAIEPILDLPIGISWALGNGSLANYINANRFDVTVSAGIRLWFSYDVASIGVLIARPSLSNKATIQFEYSPATFTEASVTRPFPTLVFGFAGDVFMITASYDQLRNTDGSGMAVDPNYLPNEVLSRAFVFGLSINPFTAARNAVGAANPTRGDDE
jgi:hypothetical protein